MSSAVCCPQVGSCRLRDIFSSSRLHRTDHCPLHSTRSPPRAGCSSQTCGVCSGGTCGACGGSGSSPHTQSCSSPRSWGHSSPRSWGRSRGRLGGIWGAFRGGAFGDALERGLALLLVLLAGHLGGRVQELRKRQTAGQTSTQKPPLWTSTVLSFPHILKAW